MRSESSILVVNPGHIYPVRAMSQKRTHYMMKTLAKDFKVGLATPLNSDEARIASLKAMAEINGTFHDLGSAHPKNNLLKRRFSQLKEYLAYYMLGFDRDCIAYRSYQKAIKDLILSHGYKFVISNYWEGSFFFKELDGSVFKILDPHYSVGENWEIFKKKRLKGFQHIREYRRLKRNSRLECSVIEAADLLLPLSTRNKVEFEKDDSKKPMILVPDGNDVEYYASYPVTPDPNTVLFYGVMDSMQNITAFNRFYREIYPTLKEKFPRLRLLVVGGKPPESIRKLHNGDDIIVTGFVEDVRPWLAQAWFKIIPLELGSGFRGRVIELMAMGIPVIGTHNALDSVAMEHGRHGFIADSNEQLTEFCLEILTNHSHRHEISQNALAFAREKYSLEATFGRLRDFLREKMEALS